MFTVERFGVSKRSQDDGNDNGKVEGSNNKPLATLLQKSKDRLKQKDIEAEAAKNVTLLRQKAAIAAQKEKEKAAASRAPFTGKRKHTPHIMETEEERKQRKAQAKLAKKERKAKMRAEGVSALRNDVEETALISQQQSEHMEDEHEKEEEQEEDVDSKTPPAVQGFAAILQQLDPNRAKKIEVKVASSAANSVIESLPTTQETKDADNIATDTVVDEKSRGHEAVDISNQYSLEDSSTPETFVPVTVEESVKAWGVDMQLADTLLSDGITSFFPVQTAVLPLLLRSASRPYLQPRDICVSAPTGSGKTLSYALPIIQTLRSRKVTRLRALVLLPSRELASQVHRVFCHLSSHTNLMIALATGTTQIETERKMMVDCDARRSSLIDVLICTPGRLLDHLQGTSGFTLEYCQFLVLDEADRLLGNAYDHWVRTLIRNTGTVNATQSSRELAMRSYQFHSSTSQLNDSKHETASETETNDMILDILQRVEQTRTGSFRAGSFRQNYLQRLLFSATLTDNPRKLSLLGIHNPLIIRTSLLPSDILSRTGVSTTSAVNDDGKKATITTSDNVLQSTGYLLPSTLTESVLICEAAARPLTLISLLHEAFLQETVTSAHGKNSEEAMRSHHVGLCRGENPNTAGSVLIFASSVESAHRLCRLLQLYNGQLTSVLKRIGNESDDDDSRGGESDDPEDYEINRSSLCFGGEVKEMTRIVSTEDRLATMDKARQGQVRIIVSSDQLARGIDLASVKLVINYDPPKHPRTYVHRVGRTARANREGHSITMLKMGHMGEFKKLRNAIDNRYDEVGRSKVNKKTLVAVEAQYQVAIEHLGTIIAAEDDGSLKPGSH